MAALQRSDQERISPERKKYLESIAQPRRSLSSPSSSCARARPIFGAACSIACSSSVDLVGVASGNYIGAAAETAIAQLYALMDRDMPIEERRALARDLDHLKRYPRRSAKNAADPQTGRSPRQEKTHGADAKQLAKAKEALNKGDEEQALFHAQVAGFFDPQSKSPRKFRQQTAQSSCANAKTARAKARSKRARKQSLSPEQQADAKRLSKRLVPTRQQFDLSGSPSTPRKNIPASRLRTLPATPKRSPWK